MAEGTSYECLASWLYFCAVIMAEPNKPMSGLSPGGIALIVCDSVYLDTTGKKALVGLFDKISARSFPVVHPRMCVFVSVTSVQPNTSCKLDIINAENDEVLFEMAGPMPSEDEPLAIWDLVFELPPITFSVEGIYLVRFMGNDSILIQRPITVSLAN